MGQLRQRGKVWWVRYYRNGKRYEESSGSEKKGAAIDLLKIREGDGAHGLPVTPKMGRLLFDEALTDVENDYSVNKKRSLPDVQSRAKNHLTPFFGGRRMTSLTTADINKFILRRQQEQATNASINRELSILKRAFRLAMKGGKLLAAPWIPKLAEDNIRQGFFERDQFEAVRKALPLSMQPVVTFAFYTGWRVPSEVLPLEWARVNRERCTVRLEATQTKNKKARMFPYGELPELFEMIEAQWSEAKRIEKERGIICPWVFHNDKGQNFLDGAADASKRFRID